MTWTVTVHTPGYAPDETHACDTWFTVRAVTWWARKRNLWVTVVKHPGPLTRWWTRRKRRLR